MSENYYLESPDSEPHTELLENPLSKSSDSSNTYNEDSFDTKYGLREGERGELYIPGMKDVKNVFNNLKNTCRNLLLIGAAAGGIAIGLEIGDNYESVHRTKNIDNEPAEELLISDRQDGDSYNLAVRTSEGQFEDVAVEAEGGYLVDIDGDGDKDLAVKNSNNSYTVYKQKGEGSNTFETEPVDLNTEEIKSILNAKKSEKLP